jgi:hypothetical protein
MAVKENLIYPHIRRKHLGEFPYLPASLCGKTEAAAKPASPMLGIPAATDRVITQAAFSASVWHGWAPQF